MSETWSKMLGVLLSRSWQKERRVLDVRSDWVDIFCEHWRTPEGQALEYWRVERPDSMIVVPVYEGHLILPLPDFRPGVGRATLDFPGGRMEAGERLDLAHSARRILRKELGVEADDAGLISVLDACGQIINSSFNNQRLFVTSAELRRLTAGNSGCVRVPLAQIDELSRQLSCLQCSYALQKFKEIHFR
jgi:ADP-ribose pyrophosphatase YjhB (NUDIX family)